MTREDRLRMRTIVDVDDSWNRFGLIDDPPWISDKGKTFEIMYEDMDGRPCRCNAVWTETHVYGRYNFKAVNGPAKGNWMSNVFAYRYAEEADA